MSPEEAQLLERATHIIVQQVDAMKQMVNAFSDYARAPEMTLALFNLNQLVTEVAELYRLQDPSVEIRLDLDARLTEIEADRGRVRQILANLITNAHRGAARRTAWQRSKISTRLQAAPEPKPLYSVYATTARVPEGYPRPPVRSLRDRQAARNRTWPCDRQAHR